MEKKGAAALMRWFNVVAETTFEKKSLIFAPLDRVFNFCTSRSGFERHFPYTVDWLNGPERWQQGSIIHFRFRYLKQWFNYQAEIVSYQTNELFVDEMRVGPYKYFIHEHTFQPLLQGTLYTDKIRFTLGYGNLVDQLLGLKILDTTFTKRHSKMKEILETISQIPNCKDYCS